ncbi:uncharacterized protein [Nicotiana sylvestris]|uniref:uncharacterized protein n=1 Tax=Nicotiana sylvestris TaxID=4096 RepID=UPI00388C7935
MTHSSIKELVNYDPEIERSLRLRRKGQTSSQTIACEEMENQEVENINPREVPPPVQIEDQFDEVALRPANRILRDYARLDQFNCESSVRKPPVAANNFEIRTELVETAKYNGVSPEAIKLRIFSFSLKGDAKTWLRSLPQRSITTWDKITQKFLNKDFFPAKTTKLRQDISNFLQTDTESIYQAWERLKAMLRKSPHHDIPEHMQLYIFYHGLKPSSRNVIDAAAGGSVTEEALQLLNEISENVIQWSSERIIIKKAATVNQADVLNILTQQIVSLAQKFESFQYEQVNVIGYKSYAFGSSMAHKHPGFQWSNPNGAENSQNFQKQPVQGPPGYQNLNRGQLNFKPYQQAASCQQRPQQAHPSLDDLMYKYIKATDEKMESQTSALKNLEIQLSQLQLLCQKRFKVPYQVIQRKIQRITLRPSPYGQAVLQFHALWKEYILKKHCDSGASINLMPFSIFKKLDLGEIKDTSVSLQFADQSTKKPKGIIENVLVRVDKFVFPVDFIVLEMKECPNEPIIFGRPFLAIGRAIIDVHQGQLILKVDEERVIFDMQNILRYSTDETSSSCFSIDMISYLTDEFKDDQLIPDSVERCLIKSGTTQDDDPTIKREAEILDKDSEEEKMKSEKNKKRV